MSNTSMAASGLEFQTAAGGGQAQAVAWAVNQAAVRVRVEVQPGLEAERESIGASARGSGLL